MHLPTNRYTHPHAYSDMREHIEAMKNTTAFYIVLRCFCDLSFAHFFHSSMCWFVNMWGDNKKFFSFFPTNI